MSKFNLLVIADSGGGKTHAIITALLAGMTVRILSAESNCLPVVQKILKLYESMVKAGKAKPLREGQFAICVPDRPKKTAEDMAKSSESSLTKSIDAAFKSNPLNRAKHNRFANICKSQASFVDTFTGVDYGKVDDWGEDTLFMVDSMTILCESILAHIVGDKVAISQPEWGTAQGVLMQYLSFLTEDLACSVYMTAHPNKEIDINLSVTRIYPSNLGQALNPKIPGKFTEVVWGYREEEKGEMKYYWSTKDRLCVTRYTTLPCSDKIPQDFGLILNPKI